MPETTLTVTPTIAETPSVLWSFDECGKYLGNRECEVRLYAAGAITSAGRKFLSIENKLDTVNFEILERGGCGQGSLSMLATWDELQFSGGERADVYLFGRPLYRGWVRVSENDFAPEERVSPQLYGLMEQFDHWLVRRAFAYGTGDCAVDLATVFTDLVNHAARITGRVPNATISTETIGVTVTEFDATGKSLASAINMLLDLAPDTAIWGCDFDNDPDWRGVRQDRIYLRGRNTACASVYALGKYVTGYTYPRDSARVVNKIVLTGGPVLQPNLLPNGGFEKCVRASEDAGNLLIDFGFEAGNADGRDLSGTNWTAWGSGQPTIQYTGNGGAFGSARNGQRWLELDENTEGVWQDVYPVVGRTYRGSCWARLEQDTQPNAFTMTLQAMDASNNVLAQVYASFDAISTTPLLSAVYQRCITPALDLSDYPTATHLRFLVAANGGSASDDGVLIDDCGVYQDCGEAQELWHAIPTGAAKITDLDWAYTGAVTPHAGGLSVKMTCASIALSADTGELYMLGSESPNVNANERYTLLIRWHVDGAGSSSDEALSIGAENIKSDNSVGTLIDSRNIGITIGNPSTWRLLSVPIITESTTARLRPFVRVRTNRTIYLDSMMLVQGEVPPDVLQYGDFWGGTEYEAEIDVTDAGLSLSSEAQASVTNYGQRESTENVAGVTDHTSLLIYAAAFFNSHAVPETMGSMRLEGPKATVPQTGTVRLVNLPDGPEELFPSRIRYTIAENISAEIDLGRGSNDMMDLLNLTAARGR